MGRLGLPRQRNEHCWTHDPYRALCQACIAGEVSGRHIRVGAIQRKTYPQSEWTAATWRQRTLEMPLQRTNMVTPPEGERFAGGLDLRVPASAQEQQRTEPPSPETSVGGRGLQASDREDRRRDSHGQPHLWSMNGPPKGTFCCTDWNRRSGEGSEIKYQKTRRRDGEGIENCSVREPRSAGMVGPARSSNNQLASNRRGWTNSIQATNRQKLQTSDCTVRTECDVERQRCESNWS